jgi:hypothetical protein
MYMLRQLCVPASLAALILWAHISTLFAAGPELRSLLPAGGQRGATIEVSAAGNFPKWPVQAWVDRPGLTLTPGEKGKLTVAIAPDAAAGEYWIRLADPDGVAAPRPFIVGTLAEVGEQEPNNRPMQAQPVGSAVVVNGRFGDSGDVDVFAVDLEQGQTLVASLSGHESLGSPMDSVLEIVSTRGGVLAFNHDQRGLDPRLEFTAPSTARYLVRAFAFPAVPNSTIAFSGSDQYVYRLTLTTKSFVDYPWPLAVTRGRPTSLELFGWNIPAAGKSTMVRAEGSAADVFDLQGMLSDPVAVVSHAARCETEPNDLPGGEPIELPVTVSGRIEKARDVDVFRFDARKGESLTFQIESRALGYPLDAVLTIIDAMGKQLARVDDLPGTRDAALTFSPPADGSYRVVVSDLNQQGSMRHVYRLRATRTEPDFEVTADLLSYVLSPGKPVEITLAVARQNGFDEEIGFSVSGLPGFVTAEAAASAAQGDTAKSVKLKLNATAGAFSGPIRIAGQAAGTSKRLHSAGAPLPVGGRRTADLWLSVVAEKP